MATLACVLGACEAETVMGPLAFTPTTATVGEVCDVSSPCQAHLLCVDGVCEQRPWPTRTDAGAMPSNDMVLPGTDVSAPLDVEPDDGLGPIDTSVPGQDAMLDAEETDADVVHDDIASLNDAEQTPVSDAGSDAEDADSDDIERSMGVDSAAHDDSDGMASQDASDVATAEGEDETTGPPLTLIIGVDQADSAGFETSSVVLAVGQGWANELTIPQAGQIVGFQASVGAPFGPSSCALFQPALWVASPQLNFSDSPTWIESSAIAIQPTLEPLVWLLAEPVDIQAGLVRFGLVAAGPCVGGPPAPSLDVCLGGDNSAAYIYAPNPGGGAWIPADAFGLAGNWVLRLLIEVPQGE